MKQFVAPILTFALVFTGVMLLGREGGAKRELPHLGKLPILELQASDGSAFRTSEMRGAVSLWSFFFTSCMGPCPKLQAEMARLQSRLPGARLFSVSVDPTSDTPEALREYASKLGADSTRWKFLRADGEVIRSLAGDGFHVFADPEKQIHSNRIGLVDEHGELRGMYDSTEPERMAELVEDAGSLLP